jgi:hypothetical protein
MLVFSFFLLDFFILMGVAEKLSISIDEVNILMDNNAILGLLLQKLMQFTAYNDYILRLPMITLHLLSAWLIYLIAKIYAYKKHDAIYALIIFMLLPGAISSAVLVNTAGLLIFLLLLFIYSYKKFKTKALFMLPFYFFIDSGFLVLYIALALYGLHKKNKFLFYFNIIMISIHFYWYNDTIGGLPSSHINELMASYAAIFSPVVFVYFFYVMNRMYLKKMYYFEWYISSTALIISIILSLRQEVSFEVFGAYLIISIPLVMNMFVEEYRIHLPIFRIKHKLFLIFIFISLFTSASIIYFNQSIHFETRHYIIKELAIELKKINIHAIHLQSPKDQKRIYFYGIKDSQNIQLRSDDVNSSQKVTFSYSDKNNFTFYVSNINKKDSYAE